MAEPAADVRRARGKRREQCRNERGIVLPVAVKRDDDGRAGVRDAGAHGSGLTARGCMLDLPQPGVRGHQRAQFRLGTVGRAIVDIDDLETRRRTKRGDDLGDQRRHIAGLVADRHNHRYGRWRFVRALLALIAHGLAGPCRPLAVSKWRELLMGQAAGGQPF